MEYNEEGIFIGDLETHKYEEGIFYTCPKCGSEYLADFITEDDGERMCIDCWSERN